MRTLNADAEFEKLAFRVERDRAVRVTPRELMRWVGARRRGTRVTAEIRARLARHQLATEPDFARVHADHGVSAVRTPEHREPYVEPLEAARRRIDAGESPAQVSVRTMLRWVGAERRGAQVSEQLRETLASFDLETRPDFETVHVDTLVSLVRFEQDEEHEFDDDDEDDEDDDGDGSDDDEGDGQSSSPAGEAAENANRRSHRPVAKRRQTFLIGALRDPRRRLIFVKPQATLREALTLMLLERVSHLPVLASAHNAKGVLRWKDVARHMLLANDVTLDAPVEVAMESAAIVDTSDPFIETIPKIIEHGYVLVRDEEHKIAGIVTTKDLGLRMLRLAEPFVALGDIELCLRDLIEQGDFDAVELAKSAAKAPDAREIEGVDHLTLGEMKRLLEGADAWAKVGLSVEQKPFLERLENVRNVRNRVMHFNPDSPTEGDREELMKFLAVMQELIEARLG